MVAITACTCLGRRPHTHVPEKVRVRLDTGVEVELDATHYELNKRRIERVIEITPARIEYWERTGMWELEFRRESNGEWFVWLRGSLEDCLEDLLQFRSGQYGDRYTAARLTIERET